MREPFLEMLAVERGASRHTLTAYARDLADAAAFMARRGTTLEAASSDDLRAWLAQLDALGLKSATIARKLSATRQYYRFLYIERIRPDDPSLHLDRPRQVVEKRRGAPANIDRGALEPAGDRCRLGVRQREAGAP